MDTKATRIRPRIRPGAPVGAEGAATHPAARRWLAAAAWIAASLALFGLFLRVSLSSDVNSDGANNALQGWDLLHGHLLLHGWLLGDANFYFFELPLNAVTSAVLGVGNLSAHTASALAYLFVAVLAVALAVAESRGPARVVRGMVVIMVLAVPLLTASSIRLVLEEPDHIGTSVFVLGSFLLIEETARPLEGSGVVPSAAFSGGSGSSPPRPSPGWSSPPGSAGSAALLARRFAAPLVCLILVAGQFSDLTVQYVAVPAVVLVCGYRALAARRLRSPDAALAAAAVVSVPLAAATDAALRHLGGFSAVAPRAHLAAFRLWSRQAVYTWLNIRNLFGAVHGADTKLGVLGFAFASVCLAAAIAGLARVVFRWLRASRAEQLLVVAIVCNVGIDLVSTLAHPFAAHELAVALPCGAVLAARLVPARITIAPVAFGAVAVSALAAVLPLVAAASAPPQPALTAPITGWLEAHGLTYGISGYWLASSATLQSGDRVRIRTINLAHTRQRRQQINGSGYEVKKSWYDPALHDATFVVADPHGGFPVAAFERVFGKPAAIRPVRRWIILIYHTNLLRLLGHPGARIPRHLHQGAGKGARVSSGEPRAEFRNW